MESVSKRRQQAVPRALYATLSDAAVLLHLLASLPAVMRAQTLSGPSALGLSPHSLPLAADSTTASLHTAAPRMHRSDLAHLCVCSADCRATNLGAEAQSCWIWKSVQSLNSLEGLGHWEGQHCHHDGASCKHPVEHQQARQPVTKHFSHCHFLRSGCTCYVRIGRLIKQRSGGFSVARGQASKDTTGMALS